jgi:hypothetical protein
MISNEYLVIIVISVIIVIVIIVIYMKRRFYPNKSNLIVNIPMTLKTNKQEEEDSLLDLSPYEMEKRLEKSCITLQQSFLLNNKDKMLPKSVLENITNRAFKNKECLLRMASYSPMIIQEALCLKEYTFDKFIATGNGGMVIAIKDTTNKKEYVVKLMEYSIGFLYEVQSSRRFMKLGIGVDIYKACRLDFEFNDMDENQHIFKVGILVMEKIETILDTYLFQSKPNASDRINASRIGTQLLKVFDVMKRNNICHYDLHSGNIGFIGTKMKVFDFGLSSVLQYYPEVTILSLVKGIFPEAPDDKGFIKELWSCIGKTLFDHLNSEDVAKLTNVERISEVYAKYFQRDKTQEIEKRKYAYNMERLLSGIPYNPNDREQEWNLLKERTQSDIRDRRKRNLKNWSRYRSI